MSQVTVSKNGGQKATLCGAPDRVSEVLEKAARAALEMEMGEAHHVGPNL
jgi:hypothetical protein